jgi:hypothetical protein
MYVRSTQSLARQKIVNRLFAGSIAETAFRRRGFDNAGADRFELRTVSDPSKNRYRNLCKSE